MNAHPVQFHPVCEAFPQMDEDALGDLTADIRKNGLRESIWRHRGGAIIDGRNRYIACTRAGIAPKFRTYEGADSSVPAFVVSLNVQRRHLNESQRAMVAARLANLRDGERPGQVRKSAQVPPITQDQAAEMLKVGRRTVQQARVVQENAVPELAQAVERGEVAVNAAATVAQLPAEQQLKAVEGRAVAETARRVSALRSVGRRAEKKLQKQLSKDHEKAVAQLELWLQRFSNVKTLAPVVRAVRAALKEVSR